MSKYPYVVEIQALIGEDKKQRKTRILIRDEKDETKINKILDSTYEKMREDGYPEAVIEAYRNGVMPQ